MFIQCAYIDLSKRKVQSSKKSLNVYEKFHICSSQSNQAGQTSSSFIQTVSFGVSVIEWQKEQSAFILNSEDFLQKFLRMRKAASPNTS